MAAPFQVGSVNLMQLPCKLHWKEFYCSLSLGSLVQS